MVAVASSSSRETAREGSTGNIYPGYHVGGNGTFYLGGGRTLGSRQAGWWSSRGQARRAILGWMRPYHENKEEVSYVSLVKRGKIVTLSSEVGRVPNLLKSIELLWGAVSALSVLGSSV